MDDLRLAAATSEGACCGICLAPIEELRQMSCLSCVCEGVFHAGCLEMLPRPTTDEPLRRCPNCRAPGQQLLVKDALDAYMGEAEELDDGPTELARLRRCLQARVRVLRTLACARRAKHLLRQLPTSPTRFLPRGAAEGLRCTLCRGLFATFSDVSLLACSCRSLVHVTCLEATMGRQPEGAGLWLCEDCQEPLLDPAAVGVKALARQYAQDPVSFKALHRAGSVRRVSQSLSKVSRASRRASAP